MPEHKYNVGDLLRYNTNYGDLIVVLVRIDLEPSKYFYVGQILRRNVKKLPYRWRIDLNSQISMPIEVVDNTAKYLGNNLKIIEILYG